MIQLDNDFGNKNNYGLQHKGEILHNNKKTFVKLDSLNPGVNGEWEPDFDNRYSSVSESIASAFLDSIEMPENFESVIYHYDTFDYKGQTVTGSISENFLKPSEEEYVLAVQGKPRAKTIMSTDEYAEHVLDVPPRKAFDNLINIFEENDVDKESAEQFLINQAAFDIIVCNQDRINNPSNFTIAKNINTNKARLVNMDYGRTIPVSPWTETTEKVYNIDEFLEEDVEDYSKNQRQFNRSLLGGMTKNERKDFLEEKGFKPFRLDRKKLDQKLDELKHRFQEEDSPIANFGLVKIETFKANLDHPETKELYQDISKENESKEVSKKVKPQKTKDFDLEF